LAHPLGREAGWIWFKVRVMDKLLAFLVGLAIGSFLNVAATRLPAKERFWSGRSRCPHCRTTLPWHDNLPLLSYFFLRGRCRFCAAAISWRYPLLELAGGLLFLALWLKYPGSPQLIAYGPFAAALLVLTAIDLEHRLLPDAITYPGIVAGLLLGLILPSPGFWEALLGVLLGGGFFFLTAWGYEKLSGKTGMGGGDVKLLAMIGAFLGVGSLPFIVFISGVLGTLVGLGLTLAGGAGFGGRWRTTRIPFGPFLAVAALLYLFTGEALLRFMGLLR
jgi:leader peptidase (prepilin peptidase) / N-methyltransferase